ncbi:MAG: histidine--tRNA ligase [Lachnospiraceae bacterium]|nr:histidine--tRNA ligase [Lachnospiraceae bacterium]
MALSKKPTTGMSDILPAQMRVREYVKQVIRETYSAFGFTQIETPCVEAIENLTSKQGGDNEKLIFRILKRGDKFESAVQKIREGASEPAQDLVVDSGLRYDLTVPLVRFYANNSANLPSPFKALQMGNVWRADRPQRGRFRQFMQCDIDILGEPSNLAEIELIMATTTCLGKLGFQGFQVRINERRILKAMAAYAGFPEESYDSVFVTLDKMDKIGMDGVRAELLENGFTETQVEKYLELFQGLESASDGLSYLAQTLGDFLEDGIRENLQEIMEAVSSVKTADYELLFDATLVRGMSYYTGTIFEVSLPQYGGSCAGGGRYDKMVGRFTGNDTPACGFSIGFERIVMILLEEGFEVPGAAGKKAYLIEKGVGGAQLSGIIAQAQKERAEGTQVLVVRMNKNKKFQKEQLQAEGYTDFTEFFKEG